MGLDRQHKVAPLLTIAAASILLSMPLLLHGPLPDGHDLDEHRNLITHFEEQFKDGEFYPRWLANMNHGLGSPTLFVFPPLPAYVCLALSPLGHFHHVDVFTLSIFLTLLGSGVCGFLWLQPLFGNATSAFSAVLYMLMPYHLVIDYYRRCAIPECWAFVWMPLILYFVYQLGQRKPSSLFGVAFACALMMFSHVVTFVIFFPLPIGMSMLQAPSGKRLRSAGQVMMAMLLGAGIAAVYLLPAVENSRYIPASRLVSRGFFQLSNQLISVPGTLIPARAGDSWQHFLRLIGLSAVSQIVLVGISVACTWKSWSRELKRVSMFLLLVCLCSFLLILDFSWPVWRELPLLHQAIQFPWRFNALLCFGTLWFAAVLSAHLRSSSIRLPVLACLGLVLVAWVGGYVSIWSHYRVAVLPGPPNERHLISDHDGWLPAWLPPGTDQRSALAATTGPKIRFRQGSGTVNLIRWSPRLIEFEAVAHGPSEIMINQFYYPRWRAQVADGTPITIGTAIPEGLLSIPVRPGQQKIRVEMPVSLPERLGRWLSVLSCSICVSALAPWRRKQCFQANFAGME